MGGLKLLDPRRQQLVLQWKWLRPLLDPQGEPPISPVIQYLTFSIQSVFAKLSQGIFWGSTHVRLYLVL